MIFNLRALVSSLYLCADVQQDKHHHPLRKTHCPAALSRLLLLSTIPFSFILSIGLFFLTISFFVLVKILTSSPASLWQLSNQSWAERERERETHLEAGIYVGKSTPTVAKGCRYCILELMSHTRNYNLWLQGLSENRGFPKPSITSLKL